MKTLRIALTLLMVGAIMALASASAEAKAAKTTTSTNAIVVKCEHDGYVLTGNYSLAALKAALNSIPPANRAYDTCAQVIDNRISTIISGKTVHTNGSGSGSGFPWVIVVIVVIVLAGGGGAFWSWRRSQADGATDRDDSNPPA